MGTRRELLAVKQQCVNCLQKTWPNGPLTTRRVFKRQVGHACAGLPSRAPGAVDPFGGRSSSDPTLPLPLFSFLIQGSAYGSTMLT